MVSCNKCLTGIYVKGGSNLNADLYKCINTARASWIMNGFNDADWDKLQSDLAAYKLADYLAIFQKYFDAYNAA